MNLCLYSKNAKITYKTQISSVQSLSHVWLFATPWTTACQASLSITNSQSPLKLMSIESVMPFNHLILYRPLFLPPIPPSIRVFSNESALHIRWPKYSGFSFSISPSNVYSGLISFPVIFKWINIYLLSSNNAIWKFFFTNINPPVSILNILLCNCFFTCTYFHWMFMMINSHCVFMMAKPCPIFQVFLC